MEIDKSFIAQLPHDKSGQLIVNVIIGLGVQVGMELVAEGIETQGQLDYLRERKVHTGQGFLVSRPLPELEFVEVLKNGLSINLEL